MCSEAERIRIGQAVTAAEANSDGEIVTVVAEQSDSYNDVVLHWAVLVLFLAVAVAAAIPGRLILLLDMAAGGWDTWTPGELIAILLVVLAVKFLVARWIFGLRPIRFALTPHGTKARRVRRRGLLLFRLATENRTRAKTGVLLYLSLAETIMAPDWPMPSTFRFGASGVLDDILAVLSGTQSAPATAASY